MLVEESAAATWRYRLIHSRILSFWPDLKEVSTPIGIESTSVNGLPAPPRSRGVIKAHAVSRIQHERLSGEKLTLEFG